MRRSSLRLYGPFIAVVLVQALLIAVAPSRAPDRQEAAGPVRLGDLEGRSDSALGATSTTAAAATAGGTAPAGTGASGSSAQADGQGPTSTGAAAQGDTSHCVGDRQFDILIDNPPCRPKFTGDNGGATYQGVTATEVKVVLFDSEPNAAVDAVLAPQGLAITEEERTAIIAASQDFINRYYELYGRKLEFVHVRGACPTTPPDVPACLEAARKVVAMQPFMVVFGTSLYDRVFDEWARAGIISVGGWHFDNSFFASEGRRGLRYDIFMDGTRSAEMLAEYYCKKMAGGRASHAGAVIHPQVGGRDTRRRLGISVPEIPANVRTAERVKALVQQCDPGAAAPVISTYVSDIERAEEQSRTTTLKYINEKVTTVTCMCDPIAPAFQTAQFSNFGYFPEYLLPGLGLLDYDKLGRLYDAKQMQHAFGPGHLAEPVPFDQTNAARMWRATGRPGRPCQRCNLDWGYASFVGGVLHVAGPSLNPATVEQAMLSQPGQGGDKVGSQYLEFGPGDYTAISDAREAYWCATCRSKLDGQNGAYISPNNARRYKLGEWPAGLQQIPVAPG